MSGEEVPKIPSIELSQNRFLLTSGPKDTHAQAQEAILQKIKEDSMLLQLGTADNKNPVSDRQELT